MKIKFVQEVPLDQTLIFEEIYPENLKVDLDTKMELKKEGAEFIYMINAETNELIGETYFIPLDNMQNWEEDEHQTYDGLNPFYGKNAMYCYSNTILPEYQKQGLGRILKAYFLGCVKAKCFDMVVAHARNNGSIQLNQSFGAEIIESIENWYQTGEIVFLYKKTL